MRDAHDERLSTDGRRSAQTPNAIDARRGPLDDDDLDLDTLDTVIGGLARPMTTWLPPQRTRGPSSW